MFSTYIYFCSTYVHYKKMKDKHDKTFVSHQSEYHSFISMIKGQNFDKNFPYLDTKDLLTIDDQSDT